MDNCIFCKIFTNWEQDITYICSGATGKLFINLNQCFPGRVFYIYKKHVKDISQISLEDICPLMKEVAIISKCVQEIFSPDLINIASLGNHVQHLHWHIIPRYKTEKNWGEAPWPHKLGNATPKEIQAVRQKYLDYGIEQVLYKNA